MAGGLSSGSPGNKSGGSKKRSPIFSSNPILLHSPYDELQDQWKGPFLFLEKIFAKTLFLERVFAKTLFREKAAVFQAMCI